MQDSNFQLVLWKYCLCFLYFQLTQSDEYSKLTLIEGHVGTNYERKGNHTLKFNDAPVELRFPSFAFRVDRTCQQISMQNMPLFSIRQLQLTLQLCMAAFWCTRLSLFLVYVIFVFCCVFPPFCDVLYGIRRDCCHRDSELTNVIMYRK